MIGGSSCNKNISTNKFLKAGVIRFFAFFPLTSINKSPTLLSQPPVTH
jgi:hypothetical protein